ncbi:D-isomer specific 2-hydroxyacid dehydrogenase NAD-binding [Penicillium malachiteum]|uniref:D-isomer specific 2-hydroxyacid dehydrogenase NAD-binding n=1 Tax=Penicillium malachiteum TaxID=1324776 RepID=UPI0025469BB3|nr:D-isomer specific 2-hydroxyacid dehydrogenase NAD-binding [Penicillium malachiteum]KAJ5731563.1 D-isomer specific 2-hydroxyacid dehydrogenase NAD-binding [Penicillium malachiteum]
MGEAPLPNEHLLVIFNQEIAIHVKEWAEKRFSDIELTLYQSIRGVKTPRELYHNATILVTFNDLPEPEDSFNLKLIHTLSAGVDHLLNNPIFKYSEIPFTTSSGIHGPPIAEWTIMNWLKVGILGYGSIGRQIARVSQALGMSVYAYTASPRPTPESRHDNGFIVPGTGDPEGTIPVSWHHGTGKEAIHEFLSLGLDHLVVSVPLTAQTTNLLGAEEFALLAKHSTNPAKKPYVTNISRGKVLNQDDLIEALKSEQLGGAALDVTNPEPLPSDHPLWDTPNVQITPHISGSGREYIPRSLEIVRINIDRTKKGLPLINAYKRGNGY